MTKLPPKPSEEEQRIRAQIEDLLERVRIDTGFPRPRVTMANIDTA